MKRLNSMTRPAIAMAAIALMALSAGCSKPAEINKTATGAPQTQTGSAVPVTAVSKLGDLGAFQRIAADAATLVDKGDLAGGKARLKDLETAWDGAEAGIKPRAAEDWHRLDRGLNNALSALRADRPTQADCKSAMTELLHTFDALQGKP
jgi:hypothetical protein